MSAGAVDLQASSDGVHGLLVGLVTLFDEDGSGQLERGEFDGCARLLGFDTSDAAWVGLCRRFGTIAPPMTQRELEESMWKKSPPKRPDNLDVRLLRDHFLHEHTPVLEAILRRLLGGVRRLGEDLTARVAGLEKSVEAINNTQSVRDEQERRVKLHNAMRAWRQRLLFGMFSSWARMVKEQREMRIKAASAFRNPLLVAVFRRWVEMVGEAQAQRAMIARVAGRIRNRVMAGAFLSWKNLLEGVWELRAKAASMIKRWMNQAAATVRARAAMVPLLLLLLLASYCCSCCSCQALAQGASELYMEPSCLPLIPVCNSLHVPTAGILGLARGCRELQVATRSADTSGGALAKSPCVFCLPEMV